MGFDLCSWLTTYSIDFLVEKVFAFFAEKWGISVFLAGFCVSFSRNFSYRSSEKSTLSFFCRIWSLRNTCGIIVSKHFFSFPPQIFFVVLYCWSEFNLLSQKNYISVDNVESFSINMMEFFKTIFEYLWNIQRWWTNWTQQISKKLSLEDDR